MKSKRNENRLYLYICSLNLPSEREIFAVFAESWLWGEGIKVRVARNNSSFRANPVCIHLFVSHLNMYNKLSRIFEYSPRSDILSSGDLLQFQETSRSHLEVGNPKHPDIKGQASECDLFLLSMQKLVAMFKTLYIFNCLFPIACCTLLY